MTDRTVVDRLDPRSKLAAQAALAAAAFAHTTPTGLAVLTALVAVGVGLARTSPVALLWPYRFLVPLLLAAPVLAAVELSPPWIDLSEAVRPTLAGYRTGVLVAVGGLYVHTTPVRDSEAAIAWLLPGRPGRLVAVSVGLVFRFLPAIREEARRTKAAMDVRLGGERPLHEQLRLFTERLVVRLDRRADRLAFALRARCLSYNPTYPPLSFGLGDAALCGLAGLAVAWAVFG